MTAQQGMCIEQARLELGANSIQIFSSRGKADLRVLFCPLLSTASMPSKCMSPVTVSHRFVTVPDTQFLCSRSGPDEVRVQRLPSNSVAKIVPVTRTSHQAARHPCTTPCHVGLCHVSCFSSLTGMPRGRRRRRRPSLRPRPILEQVRPQLLDDRQTRKLQRCRHATCQERCAMRPIS